MKHSACACRAPSFPLSNPAYLFWGAGGLNAVQAAGFSAVAPYATQADTVALRANLNDSNASFDWDKNVVVP